MKGCGVIAAREVPGPANSESHIDLAGCRGGTGRYRLRPATGRTHQLRVHMARLGIPILGDPVYPVVTDPAPDDLRRPLQLLSSILEFTDPVTGNSRRFVSRRTLQAWVSPGDWGDGPRTPR